MILLKTVVLRIGNILLAESMVANCFECYRAVSDVEVSTLLCFELRNEKVI